MPDADYCYELLALACDIAPANISPDQLRQIVDEAQGNLPHAVALLWNRYSPVAADPLDEAHFHIRRVTDLLAQAKAGQPSPDACLKRAADAAADCYREVTLARHLVS